MPKVCVNRVARTEAGATLTRKIFLVMLKTGDASVMNLLPMIILYVEPKKSLIALGTLSGTLAEKKT